MAIKKVNIKHTQAKGCVSVIIPCFNAKNTIERAIASASSQTSIAEIIVIDDQSSDDSFVYVQALSKSYPLVKAYQQVSNSGASAARNVGIMHATAEYIAFLDADDIWLNEKIEKQLSVFLNNENIALVSCDSFKVSPNGSVISRSHKQRTPVNGHEAWKSLLKYNFIPTPTVLTKRALLTEVGGFDEALIVGEDLDLWIRLSKLGAVKVVPEVLTHYVDYGGSLMKTGGLNSSSVILDMILQHLNDGRLNEAEKSNVLRVRYFEIAIQCLGFYEKQQMNYYFQKAIEHGFSKRIITNIRFKYWLKNLLGVVRSEANSHK